MKAPENLHFLIDKYLEGHANDEEKKQLHDWYRGQDHSHVDWPGNGASEEGDVYQRMLSKIDAGLSDVEERSKPVFFTWNRMIAAAVILIVVSIGGYLLINGQKPEQLETLTFKNDISPAVNKTILKLADGTEILLDDAKAGELAHQGGIRIIKNKDGQLIYDLSAASAVEGVSGYNTIATPVGGKYQVVLPDGTKVWLNALSSLRFPTQFDGKERDVETSGEVYFEVNKAIFKDKSGGNKERRLPFIVKSGGQRVEVLGTHFNINAYEDDGIIRTTLLEGSIKIKVSGTSIEKILAPGQQAHFSGNAVVKVISVEAEDVIAWKSNLFLFNNTTIDQVMQEVKRWYDIDVVYSGVKPSVLFTGIIPKNNDISTLLKVLASTGGVKFGIEGKKVIIQSSPIKNRRK